MGIICLFSIFLLFLQKKYVMEDKIRYEQLKEIQRKYNNPDMNWEDEISRIMDCTESLKSDDPTIVA